MFPNDGLAFADAVAKCGNFLRAWEFLPKRLADALEAVRPLLEKPETRPLGEELIAAVGGFYKDGVVDPAIVPQAPQITRVLPKLYEDLYKIDQKRAAGLVHDLNNTLRMLSGAGTAPPDPATFSEPGAGLLQQTRDAMHNGDIDAVKDVFAKLALIVSAEEAERRAARLAAGAPRATDPRRWHVLIVGANDEWCPIWHRAVETVLSLLPGSVEVTVEDVADRAAATTAVGAQAERDSNAKVLVILNLGLPAGAGDAHDEGLKLLEALRTGDPKMLNLPKERRTKLPPAAVVVVTGPHDNLAHQVRARELAAADYIFKGPDAEGRLRDALWALFALAPKWRLTLFEDGRRVRLQRGDSLPAEFVIAQPQSFDLLMILARSGLKPKRVLKSELSSRLSEARLARTGVLEDEDNVGVNDPVPRLRATLREGWEMITHEPVNSDIVRTVTKNRVTWYELVADVEVVKSDGTCAADTSVILVVEDQPEVAAMLAQALELRGYRTLLAYSVAGAVELIKAHDPWLVCLDMRLPLTAGRDAEDDGGLRVLAGAGEAAGCFAKLVLSDAANDDNLRERAEAFGLRAEDFIPKAALAGAPWPVLNKVFQKDKEAKRQAQCPAPNLPCVPCLSVPDELDDLTPKRLRKYLRVDGKYVKLRSEKAAQLLLALLRGQTDCVATRPLRELYGRDTEWPEEALRKAIESLREHIAENWLDHLPAAQQKQVAEAILETVGKDGYRLVVHVRYDQY